MTLLGVLFKSSHISKQKPLLKIHILSADLRKNLIYSRENWLFIESMQWGMQRLGF